MRSIITAALYFILFQATGITLLGNDCPGGRFSVRRQGSDREKGAKGVTASVLH